MNSDEWIIEQLLAQHEKGLQALIDKYAPLLKSIIRNYLYALPQHQEECLNDVFLAVWQNISSYDSKKSSFKNWICAIARYRSINTLKKYRKDLHILELENQSDKQLSYEDRPFEQELWEIELERLIRPLSEKDQELFRDMFHSEDSTEELSKKHQLTRGALYNRVSRGKAKIRHFFETKGENHR